MEQDPAPLLLRFRPPATTPIRRFLFVDTSGRFHFSAPCWLKNVFPTRHCQGNPVSILVTCFLQRRFLTHLPVPYLRSPGFPPTGTLPCRRLWRPTITMPVASNAMYFTLPLKALHSDTCNQHRPLLTKAIRIAPIGCKHGCTDPPLTGIISHETTHTR